MTKTEADFQPPLVLNGEDTAKHAIILMDLTDTMWGTDPSNNCLFVKVLKDEDVVPFTEKLLKHGIEGWPDYIRSHCTTWKLSKGRMMRTLSKL